jgi:hypothetical protein
MHVLGPFSSATASLLCYHPSVGAVPQLVTGTHSYVQTCMPPWLCTLSPLCTAAQFACTAAYTPPSVVHLRSLHLNARSLYGMWTKNALQHT